MAEQKQGNAGVDRRSFLKTSGLAGLGLAGAAMAATELGALDHSAAARKMGLHSRGVQAATTTLSIYDIEVLQFALNLEYLEAEFYCYAVTGMSLEENGVAITGPVGNPGPTTGGAKVPFAKLGGKGPIKAVAEQLMRDEVNHVKLIRAALGDYTIAKPAINLAALVPMDTLDGFLTLARDFEVVGVSAYGGAITLVDQAILQTAAQIALVEALHSGNLELLVKMNDIGISPVDALDIVPPPSGTNYFDDSTDKALAVIRTPGEVLKIVYNNKEVGASRGGFFPNGVNGMIQAAI